MVFGYLRLVQGAGVCYDAFRQSLEGSLDLEVLVPDVRPYAAKCIGLHWAPVMPHRCQVADVWPVFVNFFPVDVCGQTYSNTIAILDPSLPMFDLVKVISHHVQQSPCCVRIMGRCITRLWPIRVLPTLFYRVRDL